MDNAEEAAAYAKADFSDSNQWFIDNLIAEFSEYLRNVVDLGCGPADVPIRLARARPGVHVTAVDGSKQMLVLAEQAIRSAGLSHEIELIHVRIPSASLREHQFDIVLSKDMLHHLPDPAVLWTEATRLVKPGGAVYVMDLIRPASTKEARAIVEAVTAKEDPILKEDFYISLCAAFTPQEVRDQLQHAGLPLEVQQVTSRHMRIKGLIP
jgi:ubiquinone/menaquinone biosynthesis C-methylase UbiE